MDALFGWTLAICLVSSPDANCDPDHRMWFTSTRVYESNEACVAGWQDHVRRLSARPGWANRVHVSVGFCGWGKPHEMSLAVDRLRDLRQENLHGFLHGF